MTRLRHDRYYAYDDEHGWDLATGENVLLSALGAEEQRRHPPLDPLVEVLGHGRDGEPRWIVADADADQAARTVRRVAAEACARGFVSISVDMYLRLRDVLADDLCDRTLLLIAAPPVLPVAAHRALVDAAARSPRPHVLLSIGSRAPQHLEQQTRAGCDWIVREARPLYGVQPVGRRRSPALPEDVARHVLRGAKAVEFARSGRHAAAERLLRDVAAALLRRQSFGPAALTLLSLGRLMLERGRPRDADGIFADAAAHATAADDDALALTARIWQASARTDAGQLTAAEAVVRAALVAGTMSPAAVAQGRATLARVLLWQGRIDEAASLDLRLPDAGVESFAFVAATAVRVLLHAGRVFDAGQTARAALLATADDSDPVHVVIACTAHVRVLLAAGDLVLAEERLGELARAAAAARTPLRLVRARLLWADALRRAGRTRDADRERAFLQRIRSAVPPLLRHAIDQQERQGPPSTAPCRQIASAIPSAAARLVGLAQAEENDPDAVRRVLEFVADRTQASRADLWSADAGPATALVSVGEGLATRLGERVLEVGIAIGPEPGDPARETGVPVRLGARLVAALVCRWPPDRAILPGARELIDLAAAVAAPRIDGMLSRVREAVQASTLVPELVGASQAMGDVRKAIARAAAAPFAVLIEGESGVGKELVARAIHSLSARRERRFCDVNCAALPDDLLESELFGHARGAFTGAVADRAGLFEEADGGTLFLDEVADLSPRAQAKLLRVIQQQEVRRVGETFTRHIDVRVVSAANREMRTEAAERRFRQDLLYRLDVIRVRIPPLRERPDDVAMLAAHFWHGAAERVGTSATLTHGVLAALTRYHWPGNVRELQNVMAALAVAAPARGQVRPSLLPAAVTSAMPVTSGRLAEARARFERRFVEMALARANGSRTQAARELGLSRQGLLKMMERHGLL